MYTPIRADLHVKRRGRGACSIREDPL